MPKAVFLANAKSRQAEELFDQAVETLEAHQVQLVKAEKFDEVGDLLRSLGDSVNQGIRLAIIGGGDGTVSASANLLAETQTTLAVMPLGTANQFAKELSIDPSVESAVDTIIQGQTCLIDTASVNKNRFINTATVGITTQIARSLKYKKQLGMLAYVPAVLSSMKDIEPFQLTVKTAKNEYQREAILLVVCNGRYHAGPFVASPDASLTSGYINAYFIQPANAWQLAEIGAMALSGDHVDLEPVHLVQADKMTVTTNPKKPVTIDGETSWFDEMVFESHPATLRVCVPPTFRAPEVRIDPLKDLI